MGNTVRTRGSAFVSRRRALGGAGVVAASAAMPRLFADAAGGVNVGMRAYTAIFPGGAGIHFDHAYYRDEHLTAMRRLYGDALTRVEMRRPLVAEGEPASPHAAIVNFWIPDPRMAGILPSTRAPRTSTSPTSRHSPPPPVGITSGLSTTSRASHRSARSPS